MSGSEKYRPKGFRPHALARNKIGPHAPLSTGKEVAAARSSLDRQKIAQVLPCQQFTNARADIPAEILARGLSCVSQTWQLTREESPWREFARIPGNLRDLSKG
jgi:hypothetical protein